MSYPSDDEVPWRPAKDRWVPAMDHTGGWKESAYRPRIGEIICARIECGESVRQVCADPDMPSYATVFQWLKMHEDFDARYQAMRDRMRTYAAEQAVRRRAEGRLGRARRRKVDGRPPRDWVSGRRSTYSLKAARAFCDRLADGESGMSISADPAMPSAKCVYRWLRNEAEFREMYADARAALQRRLEFEMHWACDLAEVTGRAAAERKIAALAGRIGRLRARTWRLAVETR